MRQEHGQDPVFDGAPRQRALPVCAPCAGLAQIMKTTMTTKTSWRAAEVM